MNHKEAVKQLLYNYVYSGLIEHDSKKILSYISDDIMGFGMGEQGFVSSKEEIKYIIENTAKSDADTEYKLNFKHIDIKFPTENTTNICSTIIVEKLKNGLVSKSGLMQSLSAKLENNLWIITALHASPIILSEESINAYPLRYAENTLSKLKSELQKETFSLINQSISGGIVCCLKSEHTYPIFFVNDSMLEYLNYTRDEFIDKYGNNFINAIYEDDKENTVNKIEEALKSRKDCEIKLRIINKSGSIRWLIMRGRKAREENESEVFIGIFIDITEMANLQTKLETQAKELSISEERFRVALEKTSNIIFDYDVISGNIIHSSVTKNSMDFVTNIKDAKQNLIIGGKIINENEYIEEFDKAFEEVKNGKKQSSCIVKVKLITGKEAWNKISLTAIMDNFGKTVRVIGIIEDITKQKEAEIAFIREEQYRKALLSDAMACYTINFTKNMFESFKINYENPYYVHVKEGDSYDLSIQNKLYTRINKEDAISFLNEFSRMNILKKFENGKNEFSMEYRVLNSYDSDVWIKTSLHLVQDSITNDIKGFMYVIDIDKKKKEELELTYKSEHDPMTGIYNKGAAISKIEKKMKTYKYMNNSVFMIIDADNFKEINDSYGHLAGDRVLIKIADILCENFRKSDIVGRIGGDEFCIFLSEINSKTHIEKSAQIICESVNNIVFSDKQTKKISCSIGISMCTNSLKSFEQLYYEADTALYNVKKNGRNNFAFFEDIV